MKIGFVGDINLGEYYTSFGNGPGTYAIKHDVFEGVKHIFSSCDFLVGNLEASICDIGLDEKSPESMVLRVDPSSASQFKDSGFKVLQVANNHSVQHGEKAFEQCLQVLKGLSINAVGLKGQEMVVIENDEISLGFLAASDVPDNTFKDQKIYQKIDEEFLHKVRSSVDKVDHLVVMLHWGLEASTVPMDYQRELAKEFNDIGVSVLIGSHPHLFYEIEKMGNLVCAYSLGNFVFDLCWDKRLLKSGILEIDFSKEGKSARIWPVSLKKNGCKPEIVRDSVPLNGNVTLYDHGTSMSYQQAKKLAYFFRNILKGNIRLKLAFFRSKVLRL